MSLQIRKADVADCELILDFIKGLADYEKLSHEVVANPELLRENLFGPEPKAEVLIAEWDQQPAGFALFFHNFSTFLGRPGIYLEDLFVIPKFRAHGIGKGLLKRLAQLAVERKCGRLEWSVLDWNQPAIDFYVNVGAAPMDEWTVYRLTGDKLSDFAKS
ncbi:GNAT family N-acetyltransferase [Bdellovibrio sp. SKB1291214]|uniref:GNAT family N-acetyltransferase n=1 Tax=Bdellovibrio sp. SKB1291214 TaxID=1732569 RepID=UPI000B517601|nr:GNAT family N-acetyltransferase [Bdellovibrio sp. SKB1291214]UYL08031.1 GNAT family N-acetyltransferase [Bdellovibrio sp. SKB1291214]